MSNAPIKQVAVQPVPRRLSRGNEAPAGNLAGMIHQAGSGLAEGLGVHFENILSLAFGISAAQQIPAAVWTHAFFDYDGIAS